MDGLLVDDKDDKELSKLLYRSAEFHAFAKMRVHTDATLSHLEEITTDFGKHIRHFRDNVCVKYATTELQSEVERRNRNQARQDANSTGRTSTAAKGKQPRKLNISTYKFHSLGDYARYIRLFGGSDSWSTQPGELAHRLVKRLYGVTNKQNVAKQIGNRVRRLERARLARDRRLKQEARRNVVHRAPVNDKEQDDGDRESRYRISRNENQRVDLFKLVKNNQGNPAYYNFIPKLKDHLLGRKLNREFDGDNHNDYSDEDRNSLRIAGQCIYQVGTCQVNYTTYDNRRDYEVINMKTHPDIMAYSQEDDKDTNPYWHARAIGIYHAWVDTRHPDASVKARRSESMAFLLVRWMGAEPGYRHGFKRARLPKVGFVKWQSEYDNFAFGFLDPAQIIRGCHLIPAFRFGRTPDLLPHDCAVARQMKEENEGSTTDDWVNYYVNIFVDRDMVMRHFGGGVGHLTWDAKAHDDDGELSEVEVLEETDPLESGEGRQMLVDDAEGVGAEDEEPEFSDTEEEQGYHHSDVEGEDTDGDDDGFYAAE